MLDLNQMHRKITCKGKWLMEYYVHHVPGRLRVKIPELKKRPGRIQKVKEALLLYGGIEKIQHKRATGSVVIRYDPDMLEARRILDALSSHQMFDENRVVSQQQKERRTGEKAGQAVGRFVLSWALGRILSANGLSFLAALV